MPPQAPPFVEDDGGRAAAGHTKDRVGDCAARAIAIVTGEPYDSICAELIHGALAERQEPKSHPHHGIFTHRAWFKRWMKDKGFSWVPTMGIGTGCKVHLRVGEIPPGRIIVRLSQHYAAVVDGVVRDTYDPSRDGTRCVYGYWVWGKAEG